ncbi:TetR/AcrR family transcriptional regulator [Streptomyces sp. NPDC058420]|uniref:TetR/AcrR family transcriptional regulator n=1 Tax=Streptomyces sp. NPDC058420 TaxID=3346489 RepID=UPI003650C5F3
MPRLSSETLEQRRRHVLVSAWRCFARDGFHATSMDDVIAATGMSSSAVYRYFRSKEELIEAASQESLAQLRELFARLLAQEPTPTPAETIGVLADQLANRSADVDYDLSKIAIHAWAESLRRPELAVGTRDFYLDLRVLLTELAQRWQDAGSLAPDADPEAVATVLLTLMPGMIVNQHLVDPVSAAQLVAGLCVLGAATAAGGVPGR